MTREELILKHLKGDVIVDIGGSKGILHKYLEEKSGKDIMNIDIVGEADIKYDVNKGLPLDDNSVDTIVAGELIEHLLNPYMFIKECYRVLKDGGRLIITTPNGNCPFGGEWIKHLYMWKLFMLVNLLEKCGFELFDYKYINHRAPRNPFHRLISWIWKSKRTTIFAVFEAIKY